MNGRKVNIPSFQVKVGDEIAFAKNSKKLVHARGAREFASHSVPPQWLESIATTCPGKVLALPKREDINLPVTSS